MHGAPGFLTMQIPVRNLWVLQFFASRLFAINGYGRVSGEEAPDDLPDLVARMLADEVARRMHRGLSVGFQSVSRNERRVRGRINMLTTERHQLLSRGLVNCTFDQVNVDTPSNRLVRAALERAALLAPAGSRYRSLVRQMETAGVRGPCPRLADVPQMRQQRLLQRDWTMIAAAELLLTMSIPTTRDGQRHLPLPADDDPYLRKLFELAAYGIYRHHMRPLGWTVTHSQPQKWDVSSQSAGAAQVLPGMVLDVVIAHPDADGLGPRRVVIDTKYTSITKPGRFGAPTLSSGYIYQMYAYLMSQAAGDGDQPSEGLLLHPAVGGHFDEEAVIQGRRIRFATVDLMAPGWGIAEEFLKAISPAQSPSGPHSPNKSTN